MKNEFTAIIEPGDDGWWVASCPEVPSAIGQGRTPDDARQNVASAIQLVLEYLRDEASKEMPASAIKQTVKVG